ncbi:MAG: putative addiction module antidote protein [Rhodospirillales bacterium]|nr:putative addiction module antidote protein [Rhodospirillales bacterium]
MTFDKADLEVSRFDAAEHLDSPEAQAKYLAAAFETGDAAYIKQALSTLARARGMSELANDADVTRQGLYKALSENGDPRLSTLLGVITSLGVRLSIQPGS